MAKFFWDLMHIRRAKEPERLCLISDALLRQEMFLNQLMGVEEGKTGEHQFLLFAEHDKVYVLTQSNQKDMNELGDNANLLRPDAGRLPAPLYTLPENRGGSITFHGPGQVICYMILCLEDLGIRGPTHIANTIDVIIKEFLKGFGIESYTADELCKISDPNIERQLVSSGLLSNDAGNKQMVMSARGIWALNGTNEARKIASRGLKIVRHTYPDGTTKHFTKYGFSINVSTQLRFFNHIYPCGEDIEMISIEAITGETHEVSRVVSMLANIAIEKLDRMR